MTTTTLATPPDPIRPTSLIDDVATTAEFQRFVDEGRSRETRFVDRARRWLAAVTR